MVPSSNVSMTVTNADIYLNHLSPREALEYETTRNGLFVLLGATICDIMTNLPDDIRVLKRSRCRLTTFCFIFSRAFALAYVINNVVRRIMPIHHLYATVLSGTILCATSIGCSSYLFLQRTCAVYADSPRVRRFFTIFWMAYLLSEIMLVFTINPAYIPNTRHFKDSGIQPLLALTIITIIIYDSFVFLAISYKIGIAHVVIDREMGWRRFVLGRALPRLSQAVLRSGQQYYLLVFLVLFPAGIALYIPSTPQIFKSMLTVFLAPFMASMSCRVYRNIKLFERDLTTPYPISEIQFA